jgi:hypothetical protein
VSQQEEVSEDSGFSSPEWVEKVGTHEGDLSIEVRKTAIF